MKHVKRRRLRRYILFSQCRDIWMKLSIKIKMYVFYLIIVVFVSFVVGSNLILQNSFHKNFNRSLEDYYIINNLFSCFTTESMQLERFFREPTKENLEAFSDSRLQTSTHYAAIDIEQEEQSVPRYLITKSIKISYEQYYKKCDTVIGMFRQKEAYLFEYYKAERMGKYIEGYIKELQQISLDQGGEIYNTSIANFYTQKRNTLMIGGILLVIITAMFVLTVNHIIAPILKLSMIAKEISQNRFDSPDIVISNRDELGDLVGIFNEMKHNTEQAMDSLREKNEMEGKYHEEEIKRANTEKLLQITKLEVLQSQVNPHFLFNTLNIISRMASLERAKTTENLIMKLAALFRYNLQGSQVKVPLKKELKIIADYIYIQHIRFEERVLYTLDCNVDSEFIEIPCLTLQPIVENAIIHGISQKEEGGHIWIRVRKTKKMLRICILDNGVGMEKEKITQLSTDNNTHKGHMTSIGIYNVKNRLALQVPGSRLFIKSKKGCGTLVKIKIPIEQRKEVYHGEHINC